MSLELNVRDSLNIDKRLYFLFLCLISFLILMAKKVLIENETAAFEVLESRGQMGIFNAINALQYLAIPIIYLWKFTVIGFLLWMGSFAFGYKITYAKCWQIAMIAETIFLLPEFLKLGHFYFTASDPTLFDIRAYYPASLISLADYQTLEPKWHYPLKALNIFELGYWIILIYGVHLAARKRPEIAGAIVFSSYVLFFMIWLWFYLTVYK